ncbi:MAG: type II secretory ATPase GspE/PulE/Tfp pilus assembly ATPase PilB-like protein [Hyphomicrobiaceae bacterium]
MIDADTRALISPQHSASDIEAVALRKGMVPMWQDGLRKCIEGLTTLDEVRRVVTDV